MSLASLNLFSDTAPQPILIGSEDIVKAEALPPLDVTGFDTMTSLGYRATRSKMGDWLAVREGELVEDAISKAYKLTGTKLANPFVNTEFEERREIIRRMQRGEDTRGLEPSTRAERRAAFDKAYSDLRAKYPELPDATNLRQSALDEMHKRIREHAAASRVSTGLGDVGEGLGGIGAGMLHPFQIAALPLGAPAALWAPARGGIIAALMQGAKVAGVESLIAAGVQIPISIEQMDRLPLLGVAYGWPELFEEVGGAAIGGALFGAGMRGLVGAWRGIRARIGRDAIHPEVRLAADDGVTVGERLLMDQEANPFGPGHGSLHADATTRAYFDVAEGRPADTAAMVAAARTEARAARQADPAARAGEPETVFTGSTKVGPPTAANARPDAPYTFVRPEDAVAVDARALAKHETLRAALDENAALWGQLRAAVARGAVDKRMDQTPALAEAVRLMDDAAKTGESLAAVSERVRPSFEAQAFMAMMARDPFAEKLVPASKGDIAARLKAYADEALTVAPESEFAGAAAPLAILDRVIGLQRAVAARIAREAETAPTPDVARAADIAAAKERLTGGEVPPTATAARGALAEAAAQETDAVSEAAALGWKPSAATRKEMNDAARDRPQGDEAPGGGVPEGPGGPGAAGRGQERAAAGAEQKSGAAADPDPLSRIGAEAREADDVVIPVGIDAEGKAIFQSARLALEEAEAAERSVAQIMACAVGGALG